MPLLRRQEHHEGLAAARACATAPRPMVPTTALGRRDSLGRRVVGCVEALLIFAMSAPVWVHTERDLAVGGPQFRIRGVA